MNTTNSWPRFFGYGSLVNLATHTYPDARAATLTGWRRVWRHAKARPVAFLSVEPCATTVLHGITAQVPDGDWAALDLREHAYTRRDVTAQFGHDTAVYEADPAHTTSPQIGHPILLSYLDVVIAGYLDQFGDTGPQHFFETTHGWGPILNDRADPLYPRARPLAADVKSIVDSALQTLPVSVHPAKGALVDALRNSGANTT
ncbi:gamma-glutamylcyclotransferase [Octadecabacter sp. G9-8]|uniref:Gamma-glutamylcyclotransferase n=1 Tax=Octadecabacter dasysiphoniae TaxID=2909341 RepID=A0ABS9CVM9_9RHOB|nr:gamma-glutamylcyclotransferase family protein [Octadecabacter dasysiphoniae]MCF2870894.1 gamma-glutamylcyclotransferase [Octadecabacter dasysiphoniae]